MKYLPHVTVCLSKCFFKMWHILDITDSNFQIPEKFRDVKCKENFKLQQHFLGNTLIESKVSLQSQA